MRTRSAWDPLVRTPTGVRRWEWSPWLFGPRNFLEVGCHKTICNINLWDFKVTIANHLYGPSKCINSTVEFLDPSFNAGASELGLSPPRRCPQHPPPKIRLGHCYWWLKCRCPRDWFHCRCRWRWSSPRHCQEQVPRPDPCQDQELRIRTLPFEDFAVCAHLYIYRQIHACNIYIYILICIYNFQLITIQIASSSQYVAKNGWSNMSIRFFVQLVQIHSPRLKEEQLRGYPPKWWGWNSRCCSLATWTTCLIYHHISRYPHCFREKTTNILESQSSFKML